MSTHNSVDAALRTGLQDLHALGTRQQTRAGEVVSLPHPRLMTYVSPRRRVIRSPWRHANPWFHLFESLWMLSGRSDAVYLDRWISSFSERFAEDDGHQHGAYGHRWRHHWGEDQIETCIDILRRSPENRQAVIQMWDPREDLHLEPVLRDVPCNTTIYLRVRDRAHLDLTVCCRSNDAVWGAHGANVVHFSMLQEYIAMNLGIRVGALHQLSNNYHVYTQELERLDDRHESRGRPALETARAPSLSLLRRDLGETPGDWDDDLRRFMRSGPSLSETQFFGFVVSPMWMAWEARRAGRHETALARLGEMPWCDWRQAAEEWLQR